jgi:type VI secretion system protein ImpF
VIDTAVDNQKRFDRVPTPAHLRNTVLRELMLLLNSTNHGERSPIATHAAGSSVLNYGMPSVAGRSSSDRGWRDIAELVRRAIVDFESRLIGNSVEVLPVAPEPALNRPDMLCLEIKGLIPMSPYSVPFAARGVLDLETCRMNMRLIQAAGDAS